MADVPPIPDDLRVMAKGFWLPLGRSNFFDSERDHDLINDFNAYEDGGARRLTGYETVGKGIVPKRLNSSVYRRLITVLPSAYRVPPGQQPAANGKRYSRAFPMYNVEDLDDITEDTDPDTLALVCTKDDLGGPEWDEVRGDLESVTLVVVSEGLYVWLALYHAAANEPDAQIGALKKALWKHIYHLVGGPFFNRSSGRKGTTPFVQLQRPEDRTLQDYRNDDLGMLNFFQINLIFEGLYSAALDPRVFFDKGTSPKNIDRVKRRYSLGRFACLITADVHLELEPGDTTTEAIRDLCTLAHLPESATREDYFKLFKCVRENCVNPFVRRDILRRFLSKTSTETVHLLKLRIESCGRELLELLIKSAHLRRPLIQTEPPPSTNIVNPAQARYLVPAGANEGQLRGYIMLFAAKFPLVQNAQYYLDNTLKRLTELTEKWEEPLQLRVRRAVAGLVSARAALLDAIKQDIEGLERALEQAYMDSMVAETEKLRSEQETLAEIQRIRERADTVLPPNAGLLANVLAGLLAVVGAVIALFVAVIGLSAILRTLSLSQTGISSVAITVLETMVIVIIVVIVTIALFRVALNQQRRLISRALRSRRQAERREEQYYYEMDLRLDASMDPTGTGEQSGPTLPELLLAGQFAHAVADPPWFTSGYPERERYPVVDWSKEHAPRRSWYRVNRMGVDQALHKVYVLAHVYWPDTKKAKPAHSSRNPLRLHLVYEILFHSPSEEPTYLLHTFRAVADASQFLSREQLDGLKRLVVWKFVNPWITDTHQQVSLDGDALFSLSGKLKRQRGE